MSRRPLKPQWLLVILTGLNLFNYLDRFVLSAVLPPLQKELHLNDAQGGELATAFMLGYFLTSPLFGYLCDRVTRKWLIAGGIFFWSLGTVLTGWAPTFWTMLACRVLVGVGEASYATISPSLISDTYPPARRNNALTIFYVAIPVGAALGNILGGLVAAHWGWRHAFILAGVPGLFLALVLLPFAEPKRGQAEGTATEAGHLPRARDVLKLFHVTEYMLVCLGYVAYTFALGAFGVWGPTYLNRVYAMPVEKAGAFFGYVLFASGLLGTFGGGFAATRWRRRNPAAYSLTLGWSAAVAVPVCFAAFLATSQAWCMTFLAVSIFLLFLSTGPVNTLILETAPLNLRASAMALSIFMIHLFGDMWSPQIVGIASDHFGMRSAALILPLAIIVCAGLWLMLARRMSAAAPGR